MNPSSFSKVSRSQRALASLALLAAVLPAIGCGSGETGDETDPGKLGIDISGPGFGVDYAWARPSPSSITADGYEFVARYLSNDTTGKNLSLSEANALIAAGLQVVVVWEQGAQDVLQGFNLGVTHAKAAAAQALADGQPTDRPIYFAIDFDATSAQQTAINSYFDGVASVIGLNRTGVYAGYGPVNRLFNAGKITWAWQTYAWSSSTWDARAQLRQVLNDIGPGGEMDKDQSMVADFGQWGSGTVNTGPTACTVGTLAGTCIATTACAAMAGYVATAGHCSGAANIECCTLQVSTPPPPPPAACTVGTASGTCIETTACAAMPGYVATAGHCSGAADVECCTLKAVAPPPPPPPTCTVGTTAGTCIATTACAAMPGYVSTAGHCSGAANIECCTPQTVTPPPPPPSCTVGTTAGTCITTTACAAMPGYMSTAGHCTGAASIECCTPPPSCTVGTVAGTCIQTSACAAMPGYHSTPGYCPGSSTEECCTP